MQRNCYKKKCIRRNLTGQPVALPEKHFYFVQEYFLSESWYIFKRQNSYISLLGTAVDQFVKVEQKVGDRLLESTHLSSQVGLCHNMGQTFKISYCFYSIGPPFAHMLYKVYWAGRENKMLPWVTDTVIWFSFPTYRNTWIIIVVTRSVLYCISCSMWG